MYYACAGLRPLLAFWFLRGVIGQYPQENNCLCYKRETLCQRLRPTSRLPSRTAFKEELAFLKAHLQELSSNVLRQLKKDIVVQKKRKAETEASAKAQG